MFSRTDDTQPQPRPCDHTPPTHLVPTPVTDLNPGSKSLDSGWGSHLKSPKFRTELLRGLTWFGVQAAVTGVDWDHDAGQLAKRLAKL